MLALQRDASCPSRPQNERFELEHVSVATPNDWRQHSHDQVFELEHVSVATRDRLYINTLPIGLSLSMLALQRDHFGHIRFDVFV